MIEKSPRGEGVDSEWGKDRLLGQLVDSGQRGINALSSILRKFPRRRLPLDRLRLPDGFLDGKPLPYGSVDEYEVGVTKEVIKALTLIDVRARSQGVNFDSDPLLTLSAILLGEQRTDVASLQKQFDAALLILRGIQSENWARKLKELEDAHRSGKSRLGQGKPKRRGKGKSGRPQLDDGEAERRLKIVAARKDAKSAGVPIKKFCGDQGIELSEWEKIRDWNRHGGAERFREKSERSPR